MDCIFSTSLEEIMQQSPETQLAYLGFRLIPPSRYLRPYVQSYWYFRREKPLSTWRQEYMHPRGGFGIIFNIGDPLSLDARTVSAPIFLDGANTVSRAIGFRGQVELIGIRFHEGGAYPFLGVPLNEFRNETTLPDNLDGPALLDLYARLQETGSLTTRVGLLEEWLASRLLLGKERSLLIPASLRMLRESRGRLFIPELALELAISQRQLERLYRDQVGISPKQYAQLLRIDTARLALKNMDGQSRPSLARLAAELGFYDQSHFIREFSTAMGITPYVYLKLNRRRAEDD